MTPPRARLCLLEPCSRCPGLHGQDAALLATLRALVPSPRREPDAFADVAPEDLARLSLYDAELDRVVGDQQAAGVAIAQLSGELLPAGAGEGDGSPSPALKVTGLSLPLISAAARAGVRDVADRVVDQLVGSKRVGAPSALLDAALLVLAAEEGLGEHGLDDAARRRLQTAGDLLEHSELGGGRWAARVWELLADDAARRRAPEEARELAMRAAVLYEDLEDLEARARVLKTVDVITSREPTDDVTVITIGHQERSVSAEVQSPGRDRVAIAHPVGPNLAAAVSAGLGQVPPAEAVQIPRKLAVDLDGFCAEMRDALEAAAQRAGVGPADPVALHVKPRELALLPWELAWPPDLASGGELFRRAPRTSGETNDVRAIQGALNRLQDARLQVDGICGPATRAAMDRFAARLELAPGPEADDAVAHGVLVELAGGARPRVAVVRPTRAVERATRRGSHRAGAPAELYYESWGFAPTVIEDPRPDQLAWQLRSTPVAILHVTAGLVDAFGTPALDLRGDAFGLRPGTVKGVGHEPVLSTALDRVLPRDVPTPLIVLDVPSPRTVREAVAQLLLRNAFGTELVELGRVRAVLAMGLARPDQQERAYEMLMLSLAAGDTLAAAALSVRRLAAEDHSLNARLAFAATALWAPTRTMRMPWPAS